MMQRNAKKDMEKLQQVTLPHLRELNPFLLRAPLPVLVRLLPGVAHRCRVVEAIV